MNDEFVHKWKSQVKKGTLTFIVLNVLNGNEYYGVELIEKVRQYTSIEIAEGTLYPLLNRLKKEELLTSKWVEQESGIPRKYYVLTETGAITLDKMKDFWNNLEASIKTISK